MTLALHLGLHWGMFMALAGKALRLWQTSRIRQARLPVLGGGIAAYGVAALIRRDLLAYMLVRTQFVFLDFSEPAPLFYLDYLAVMGMFVFAAHYGMKFLKRNRKKGFESFICIIDAACAEENVQYAQGKLDCRALRPVLFGMPDCEYLCAGDGIGSCMPFGKELKK